ncbi:hypothetical protein O0I10_003375 [Lichtheimia ornata]|uniref:ADP-ribosylation factor-like protein 6-interacting protein 4 n=1 Tax=Lichtheimia ornata TaxID=688661 RepID=A0AAD7V837_9FUNG|nr:uncharacterized protein O0I10_003375 [Lichtheimia ornata]KAJ8660732.1 hypothetical protein O0I10_003375 [Lichtheimia ornata]
MGEHHHRHKKRKHEDHHSERKRHRHSEKKHKRHHSRHESKSSTSSANDLEELKRLAKLYNKKEEKKHDDASTTVSKTHSGGKQRAPMIPQTKEDYEKQRSVIRHEYDPETGRMRLVRGSGEILESLVSRDQHRQINKTATMTDGMTFQKHVNRGM